MKKLTLVLLVCVVLPMPHAVIAQQAHARGSVWGSRIGDVIVEPAWMPGQATYSSLVYRGPPQEHDSEQRLLRTNPGVIGP
jgi:hypothetical protein